MSEKRKEERIIKTVRSEVRSDEALTFSSTVDMSRGGIFISTPEPLGNGTSVELSIILPGGEEVTVQGTVKWVREDGSTSQRAGMGIEFGDMDEDTKSKIGDLLK